MNRYNKISIALQHYLLGARYYKALSAFAFAKNFHTGLRKDGVTPEFQHQIEIALYITTLRDVQFEEDTIAVVLLHDVVEDYTVKETELRAIFGDDITSAVIAMSKYVEGEQQFDDVQAYFDGIARDPCASIAKGGDRVHNLQSMPGVFTLEKQRAYIQETRDYFLPMLKVAAETFPTQRMAYMNIRTVLKSQIELLEHAIEHADK